MTPATGHWQLIQSGHVPAKLIANDPAKHGRTTPSKRRDGFDARPSARVALSGMHKRHVPQARAVQALLCVALRKHNRCRYPTCIGSEALLPQCGNFVAYCLGGRKLAHTCCRVKESFMRILKGRDLTPCSGIWRRGGGA
jgi:hypothetical protein